MSADCSFQYIKSYLAAYPSTKETEVHKTTKVHQIGCQNTLKATCSKHNQHADTVLNNSVSLILSPSEHEYYKCVIYSVGA